MRETALEDVDRTRSVPGLGFTPFETRTELILSVAREADRLGAARVAVAEAMGHASPVLLAEIAQATERVELATTVLSVWSRSPAVLAMTAAGLQRLSGGRFVLGLGADWRRTSCSWRPTRTSVGHRRSGPRRVRTGSI